MTNVGIPVPPGFTVTTAACNLYRESGTVPAEVRRQVSEHLAVLQARMEKTLGDPADPLLVSVRSGAKISMPGMMDTVLNLGLSDKAATGLAKRSGDERFAYDAYRRFIQMYSNVVLHVDHALFEKVLTTMRKKRRLKSDAELGAADLKAIVREFKKIVRTQTKRGFPQDPQVQLMGALEAVFRSWDNERAQLYRRMGEIPDDLGTACTVQAMVFGNRGNTSASGVGFTRNPATGDHEFYGEFLLNAQGEDVVAGIRTPRPLNELKRAVPAAYNRLQDIAMRLERHYRRHAGLRIHDRRGPALYAADADREAHRDRGGARRHRHGGRGPDHAGGGGESAWSRCSCCSCCTPCSTRPPAPAA